MQSVVNGASVAHLFTCALLTGLEAVDLLTYEWDETKSVSDKLIVQGGRVLTNLNQVNCQCGNFRNHDSSQRVGDREISVFNLKLHCVL